MHARTPARTHAHAADAATSRDLLSGAASRSLPKPPEASPVAPLLSCSPCNPSLRCSPSAVPPLHLEAQAPTRATVTDAGTHVGAQRRRNAGAQRRRPTPAPNAGAQRRRPHLALTAGAPCTARAVGQESAGIFLWDLPQPIGGAAEDVQTTVPMSLAPSITTNASFCKWSKVAPQLAIGTHQGKVIIFNKGEGVMQLHEKKGAWLAPTDDASPKPTERPPNAHRTLLPPPLPRKRKRAWPWAPVHATPAGALPDRRTRTSCRLGRGALAGKHGAPVTCGDWLFDNRLGLASGLRVKISQPIAETGSKWESYSKFRLGGMLSKARAAPTPRAPRPLRARLFAPTPRAHTATRARTCPLPHVPSAAFALPRVRVGLHRGRHRAPASALTAMSPWRPAVPGVCLGVGLSEPFAPWMTLRHQVPRHIRVAGDPNRLAFTLNYPPFVAVSVGDKYLLTFDTTCAHACRRGCWAPSFRP